MSKETQNFLSPADWFHTLGTHYTEAQFIFELNQCGVIEYIHKKNIASAEDIAKDLNYQLQPLKTSLDYLAKISDLIAKNENNQFYFTEFGLKVLEHYKREDAGKLTYNLLDVRVGAYGNVWSSLGEMIRGKKIYGKDFIRRGEYANQGVHILGAKIGKNLSSLIKSQSYEQVIELGLNSSSLVHIGSENPNVKLFGIDKKKEAIDVYTELFNEKRHKNHKLIQANIYDTQTWTKEVDASKKTLVYSLHFHEFLSAGEKELSVFLHNIKQSFPQIHLGLIEVPLVPDSERDKVSPIKWMYSASDVLIHELIGIGKILPEDEWMKLANHAGFELNSITDTDAFSFKLMLFG
jgi:hypothetical protein